MDLRTLTSPLQIHRICESHLNLLRGKRLDFILQLSPKVIFYPLSRFLAFFILYLLIFFGLTAWHVGS